MRSWVLLLAAALAMAGCADDDGQAEVQEEPATETEQTQTEDEASGEDTSTEAPTSDPEPNSNETEPNNPPTANLTADAVNGTAPLNVTFTLVGSDVDGDALAWSLSINGTPAANGSSLPATVTHTFGAGNHTAVLSVDDGEASDSTGLTITVVPAGPTEKLVVTWEGTVSEPTCLIQDPHTVSEDLWGMEYRVVAGWADGMFMDFWDAGVASQTGSSDEPVGTIPEGTGNAWLCMGDSTGLLNDYTIEIWG